ncbi:ABC transporter permease, partial [Streptomyces sp. 2MCAF27]
MTATLPTATTAPVRPVGGRGLLRLALRSRRLALGLGVLAVFALTALIGPWLVDDPDAVSVDLSQGPSGAHWLGTTQTGQDVFAQLVVSARGTLLIGAAVAALATAVSVVVGIGGGFLGGVADETISLISNVFLVIPGLPLVIVVSAYVKG